jgi:hypothetical protein
MDFIDEHQLLIRLSIQFHIFYQSAHPIVWSSKMDSNSLESLCLNQIPFETLLVTLALPNAPRFSINFTFRFFSITLGLISSIIMGSLPAQLLLSSKKPTLRITGPWSEFFNSHISMLWIIGCAFYFRVDHSWAPCEGLFIGLISVFDQMVGRGVHKPIFGISALYLIDDVLKR